MVREEWEARWEDDGGPPGPPTEDRQRSTPTGVIVVVALVPFFVLPLLGLALGGRGGTVGLVVGGLLGLFLALALGRFLGRRLEGAAHHEQKRARDTNP
jgi:hypothetical protein